MSMLCTRSPKCSCSRQCTAMRWLMTTSIGNGFGLAEMPPRFSLAAPRRPFAPACTATPPRTPADVPMPRWSWLYVPLVHAGACCLTELLGRRFRKLRPQARVAANYVQSRCKPR